MSLRVQKSLPKRTPTFIETTKYDKIFSIGSILNVSNFTEITNSIGFPSGVTLEMGVTILNYNKFDILIKTNDISHGANSGFYLKPSESIFIECENLNKIQVKPVSGTQTVNLEIIGG